MISQVNQLFLGKLAQQDVEMNKEQAFSTTDSLAFRIPSLLSARDKDGKETVIAVCDFSQAGGDFGRMQVVERISGDGGKTFGEMKTVFSLPVAKAPQKKEDYRSALAIDPILCQCKNGDVLIIVDMFPESKAFMHRAWLDEGSGYTEIDGKKYLALHTAKTKVGNGIPGGNDKIYTVREKGWIYTPDGRKTKYYLPEHHSAEYAFETMGDMYYAVGEGEYIDTCPPLMPTEEDGHDIYVGNIYLNCEKGTFDEEKYEKKTKRIVSPEKTGDEFSDYECVEGQAAPLSAPVAMRLFVLRSTDCGRTWSQPVDITGTVKREDEIFLGTGPGVATVLSRQKDESKNGRILVPVYTTQKTYVLYSDDNGFTWKRSGTSRNIDETQLIESDDGRIFCFGRQRRLGKTPFSVSCDGGESWKKLEDTPLSSIKCQKSFLLLPSSEELEYEPIMDKSKRYIVCSCASGEYQRSSKRFGGVVTLGEIDGDEIHWIKQRKIITDGIKGPYKNFYAYSSLAFMKDGTIGLFYEAMPTSYLPFRTFTLKWLCEGEKPFGFPLKLTARLRARFTR